MKATTRKVPYYVRTILWIVPPIYKAYMHIVFLTSKRVFYNAQKMKDEFEEGTSLLGACWHQDVMLLPFTFRNYDVVTMVSKSNLGELMATAIRRLGFTPVRGGSSLAGAEALAEVIDYVRTHNKIFFGITVDGSRGPQYKVKKGIIVIAKEAGVPIYPVRCCAKRSVHMGTWDQTLIPLPFNEFAYFWEEPVRVPPDADMDVIEVKRQEVEDGLMKLVKRSEEHFQTNPPKEYPGESKTVHYWTDMAGQD